MEEKKYPYDKERHIRYLNKTAFMIKCPPCSNKKIPDRLGDHIVKWTCICSECHKVWRYSIRSEQAVKDRKPQWHYTKEQPFLKEQSC